jgi:hypothetical protein
MGEKIERRKQTQVLMQKNKVLLENQECFRFPGAEEITLEFTRDLKLLRVPDPHFLPLPSVLDQGPIS